VVLGSSLICASRGRRRAANYVIVLAVVGKSVGKKRGIHTTVRAAFLLLPADIAGMSDRTDAHFLVETSAELA